MPALLTRISEPALQQLKRRLHQPVHACLVGDVGDDLAVT